MKHWCWIGLWVGVTTAMAQAPFLYAEDAAENQRYLDIIVRDSSLLLLGSNDKQLELVESDLQGQPYNRQLHAVTDTSLNPFQFISTQNTTLVLAEQRNAWWASAHLYTVDAALGLTPFVSFSNDTISQSLSYCATAGDYYYCTGIYATPSMTFGNDMWVVKIHKNGNVVWNRTYGEPDRNEVASSLQVVDDQLFVFGDKNLPALTYNPFHLRLDTAGNLLSQTALDWSHNGGVKMSLATEDAIYITGESATATSMWFDIYLEKWDLQGQRLWRKLLPQTEQSETGFDIKFDGTLLWLTGYAHDVQNATTDMHYTVIDTAGTILETQHYHLGDVDIGYRLAFGKNGVYVVGSGSGTQGIDYLLAYDTSARLTTVRTPWVEAASPIYALIAGNQRVQVKWVSGLPTGAQVQLWDATGRCVERRPVNSTETNFYIAEKGIYFIRYYDEQRSYIRKISLF